LALSLQEGLGAAFDAKMSGHEYAREEEYVTSNLTI
jgi:hypothetical protein